MNASAKYVLLSPLNGKLMPLDQVPDDVFAQKILGDGVAIVPEDGKLRSPVDGEISSVAETLHAYGFSTDDGLEILVHFGLNTVELKGEGFKPLVKAGDKVKAGDPVAEIDLDFIKSKGISPITPVLICDGADNLTLEAAEGSVKAGQDVVIALKEETQEAAPAEAEPAPTPEAPSPKEKRKPKFHISFDFFQKLGKSLMAVVAVMPAAGLLLSLGNVFQIMCGNIPFLVAFGRVLEELGWAFFNNLHLLFAVVIGGSWAKEKAGGSFAAIIAFILINRAIGAIFNVTPEMLNEQGAFVYSLLGDKLEISNYFTNILGAASLNMGVFIGIISGFWGGVTFNKFYNFRKLPEVLSFFNGKRFVPIAVTFYSLITALVLSFIWPIVQSGINAFGIWIATSQDSSPILAPFVYGTLERLLLPFGLHHMLTVPVCYTSFGGEYLIQTGINAGSYAYGQEPLWLAWVTDLINFKNAGDTASYQHLLATVIPSRFKVGQMIGSNGMLIGIMLALYRCIPSEKRGKYYSMFLSTILATLLTGVTEPAEFMFMFCAMPLYVVYAILQGIAFGMAGLVNLRVYSFGSVEFLTRLPMALQAGLLGDVINFVVCCVAFLIIGFFVAYFMVRKWNFQTPGRSDRDDLGLSPEEQSQVASQRFGTTEAERIIVLLGGRENIDLVDACMTRLRITVKDPTKVASQSEWMNCGARGLLVKGNGIQAIYGTKADILKCDINDIL